MFSSKYMTVRLMAFSGKVHELWLHLDFNRIFLLIFNLSAAELSVKLEK